MRYKEILEAAEHYTGVVEPGSRPSWGQEITLMKPIRAYHATHKGIGKVLTNRDVQTYNSMGTWLSSNRDMTLKLYGPHTEAYLIPPGRYLLAKRSQELWELILNCLPIIERHVGKEAAEHLMDYPFTSENLAWMQEMRRAARARFTEKGGDPNSVSADGTTAEYIEWLGRTTGKRDLIDRWSGLQKSHRVYQKVCTNKDYCRDYRDFLVGTGKKGIIWNGRDNWDGKGERQTIFLIFHEEDIHPIRDEAEK